MLFFPVASAALLRTNRQGAIGAGSLVTSPTGLAPYALDFQFSEGLFADGME
jgi:hypothetical protein